MIGRGDSERAKVHTAARTGTVKISTDRDKMQMETPDSSLRSKNRNSFPKVGENAFGTSPKGRNAFPTGNVSTKGKTFAKKTTEEQTVEFLKDKHNSDLKPPTDADELNSITLTKIDARKDVTDETSTLTERIKKIWDNIVDKSITKKMSEQKGDLTVTYMLNCIERALNNSQEKLKRFQKKFVRTDLYVELQENNRRLNNDITHLKAEKEEFLSSFQKKFVRIDLYAELKENNRRLNHDITNLKAEKNELLNRLSKIAGANLTDNNPNIADLSDPNRATKLAEQYSELYDNPWTDAFEELEITDEKKCIDYLLDILVESYKLCGTISRNQQCWLTDTLLCPTKCISQSTETRKTKTFNDSKLSTVQSRSLADLRKQCAEVSADDVKMFISKKQGKWVENENLKIYSLKCIELCWLMHLQTPPVYLDAANVETNSTFDANKYKQYTKSGSKIDYLVWPTLLLHKDGPILCKGVAQGM